MAQSGYTIEIGITAAKQLSKVEKGARQRISTAIQSLATDPRPSGCTKLTGQDAYRVRVRVGDYRVVYRIQDAIQVVRVDAVGHRREIYRRM